MKNLSLTTKLSLIVGAVSTFITALAILLIVQIVFHSIEENIKNDLSIHHLDVKELATPEKSSELANYLRLNNLSLYIYDNNGETIARYGIYRNLDEKTLEEFRHHPLYIDKKILDHGEYDIYNKDNIQVATKNEVLYILKNSFYTSLIILFPIVWIVAILTSIYASKIVLSPLIQAKKISHELKTPLARVVSTLQVLIDDAPRNLKDKLKYSSEELIRLGGNVDSILSLSLLNKNQASGDNSNLNREIKRILDNIPKKTRMILKISRNVIVPINPSLINIILRNIIDNAVRYNYKNSLILISVKKTAKIWSLEVKNKISTDVTKKGNGLGMTIVKEICHNQNLNIDITKYSQIFSVKIQGSYE